MQSSEHVLSSSSNDESTLSKLDQQNGKRLDDSVVEPVATKLHKPEHRPEIKLNSTENEIKSISTESSSSLSEMMQSSEMSELQKTMSILVDNPVKVIPMIHEVVTEDDTSSDDSSAKDEPEISAEQEQKEIPSESTSDVEESELQIQVENEKVERRGTSQLIKNSSPRPPDDPYIIEIPLKKKVNRSTRRKLWHEIEKRKPFITQNVAFHIENFAKPPFVTWGCKGCQYPYEVKSYSREYWHY